MKRTACECGLNNSVGPSSRVLECASRSITGAGMGVGLCVIGTEKGEGRGDKASAELFAVPGK